MVCILLSAAFASRAAFAASGAGAIPGTPATSSKPAAKPAGAHHSTAAATRAPAAPSFDFSLYQKLLNQYLSVTSEKGEPLETRFNYEGYHDEAGREARAARIHQSFLVGSPGRMDSRTRLAWAINFYNYLVIEQATQNLLIPDKFRQRYLSVKDMPVGGAPFFEYPLIKVDSVAYSLDEFERHFLFADFDHKIGTQPPPELDPRVHFAVVCGAIGCPPLQPRAFSAESLDIQLDNAVRQSLASSRHFVLRDDPYAFQISSIFGWYVADFGGNMKVIPWIQRYVPKATSDKLQIYATRGTWGTIPWDWKLNQTLGWRFQEEMRKGAPAKAPGDSS